MLLKMCVCCKMIASSLVFSLFVLSAIASHEAKEMSLAERTKFLKFQLEEELRSKMDRQLNKHNHFHFDKRKPPVLNADIDYVDLAKVAITPINEDDDRKKHERYKLRQLATTTRHTTVWTRKSSWPMLLKRERLVPELLQPQTDTTTDQKLFNPLSDENIARVHQSSKKQQTNSNVGRMGEDVKKGLDEPTTSATAPVEIFYRQRRILQDECQRDVPQQWTHCEDLITPYLTGMKGEFFAPKLLSPSHRVVLRLVQLLTTNVTQFSKEDIYSLMYQISNLQLRLFQWHDDAIRVLLRVICKGEAHTYQNIKRGLRELFSSWHLDISNATNLLAQSRLFRPYCLHVRGQGGSTKSSKFVRYTSPKPASSKCDGDDSDQ